MRRTGVRKLGPMALAVALLLFLVGCGKKKEDPGAGAPPPAQVVSEQDGSVVKVEHPEQFPLATASEYDAAPTLVVTGVVNPDITRTVPVVSLTSGRVVDVRTRLGDPVKKGQLLLRVQSADISQAFSDYRMAVADETLARTQLDRAKLLHDKGAMSLNDLQIAQGAEDKAQVAVETSAAHIRVLGGEINQPTGIVDIYAPVSGVITDQEVTNAAGVQALAPANPFTISDLSYVWIVCDVYENDLANVHVGDSADIRLNAYPGQVITGRIGEIGAVLDPNIRSARVRVEVRNPGMMRVGMFVTATFHGQQKQTHAAVPASAILHLHDRDWVYLPAGDKKFRRAAVVGGASLPNKMQEIVSGLRPGQQVVSNALELQNTTEE